jgi:hypothetical protein
VNSNQNPLPSETVEKKPKVPFFSLDIRTRIVIGILGTGALALAVFIFFVFNQTQQVTGILAGRLEKSVTDLAEEQLKNTVLTHANQTNQLFENATREWIVWHKIGLRFR